MTAPRPLRVLHLATAGLPHLVGGSVVYMHHLARAQAALGYDVVCAYHQNAGVGEPVGPYDHDGMAYRVLPPLPPPARSALAGRRPAATPGFAALLAEFRPDVVHFHDATAAAGLAHLDAARAAGARTVMTYHSPGQTCQQGELLFAGRTVCDGELIVRRCAECRLRVGGAPRLAAAVAARVPLPFADPDAASRLGKLASGRAATALWIESWGKFVAGIDLVHGHAAWVVDLMRRTGVPEGKLRFLRTGLPRPAGPVPPAADPAGRLRVTFLGRGERIKGIESLVEGVKLLPAEAPVLVSLVGRFADAAFEARVRGRIAGDPRFAPPTAVASTDLPAVWAATDVLAVPSIWLETGPLVVLEAFAAGVPVLGSRLGGIAELVADGVDGLLHAPGDPAALAAHLRRLLADPGLLARLRAGVRPPRTLADLAADLDPEYRRLLGG